MQTSQHPAVEQLMAFFADMHAWETEAFRWYQTFDVESHSEDERCQEVTARKLALERIFESHCERGKNCRRLKDQGLSYGNPPEYQAEEVEILSVIEQPRKVIVECKQTTGNRFFQQFELVDRDGRWWLKDSAKYKFVAERPWSKSIL